MNFRYFMFLSVAGLILFFNSCASSPEIKTESREIAPGTEVLVGRDEKGKVEWMATRSTGCSLSISPALPAEGEDAGKVLSRHGSEYFRNPEVLAVLTASPHKPVRFRSGFPQSIRGFYRVDDITYSIPDGCHDSLGVTKNNRLVLLSPGEQEEWDYDSAGGFYTILSDEVALNPVPVRDAVSALGWSDDEEVIILLVIRGGAEQGYSYEEAGNLLSTLGAREGIAMDGGGSARLVWREKESIHSFPVAPLYRAVPNHLLLIE